MASLTDTQARPCPPPTQEGYFITIEGIDGAGKTTQIEVLAAWFEAQGYEVVRTRNPGGTRLGEALRRLVLTPETETGIEPLDPWAEVYLYLADRVHHIAQVIRPALTRGAVVLCDRYTDSTLAYQGWGRGLDIATLTTLTTLAQGDMIPRFTILLDGNPTVLQTRVSQRGGKTDRFEQEAQAFYTRVREGFLHLANQDPQRFIVFNAELPADEVSQALRAWLAQHHTKPLTDATSQPLKTTLPVYLPH
jgi:dTMP kinase